MRFLVTLEPKHMIPPDMVPNLIDGLIAWSEANNWDAIWSNAGHAGGGGIANVDSLEQLDELMIAFPMGPFYDVKVTPIVDLGPSMERVKARFEQIAAMMNQ